MTERGYCMLSRIRCLIVLVACFQTGCSLTLEDMTPLIGGYYFDPADFNNHFMPIRAKVVLGSSTRNLSLETTVDGVDVEMVRSGSYPNFEYSGSRSLSSVARSCGFTVDHNARAVALLGVLRKHVSRIVVGDDKQLARLEGNVSSWGFEILLPQNAADTIQTTQFIATQRNVRLVNLYDDPITVEAVELTCSGGPCPHPLDPDAVAVLDGSLPELPKTLSCGHSYVVPMSCIRPPNDGAEITFHTDKGTVKAPIFCYEFEGA